MSKVTITTRYWSKATIWNAGKLVEDEISFHIVPGWTEVYTTVIDLREMPFLYLLDMNDARETAIRLSSEDLPFKTKCVERFECFICQKPMTEEQIGLIGAQTLDHLVACPKCVRKVEKESGTEGWDTYLALIKKAGKLGIKCTKCEEKPVEKSGAHTSLMCSKCADEDQKAWDAYENQMQDMANSEYEAARRESLSDAYWSVFGQPYDERYE